jgi:hypothetical protein
MTDQPVDRPPDRLPISLTAAADQFGLTVEAIRSRCRRGTLPCQHLPEGGWVVTLTDQVTGERPVDRPHDQPETGHDHTPTGQENDALVALLERQTHQIAELSAAAALWQERARFLGVRLAALEAGPTTSPETTESANAPVERSEPPGRVDPLETTSRTLQGEPVSAQVQLATGWRRWFRMILES